MSATSKVTLKIPTELKQAIVRILRDYDLTLDDALHLFLDDLVATGTLPFDIPPPRNAPVPVVIEQVYQLQSLPRGRGDKTRELTLIEP